MQFKAVNAPPDFVERRKCHRVSVAGCDAEVVLSDGARAKVRIMDVSVRGMRISTDAPLEQGEAVVIEGVEDQIVAYEVRWVDGVDAGLSIVEAPKGPDIFESVLRAELKRFQQWMRLRESAPPVSRPSGCRRNAEPRLRVRSGPNLFLAINR